MLIVHDSTPLLRNRLDDSDPGPTARQEPSVRGDVTAPDLLAIRHEQIGEEILDGLIAEFSWLTVAQWMERKKARP